MEGELIEGRFLLRRNRFAADVEVDGATVVAHVPNSGRMRELLAPGATVLLEPPPAGVLRRTAFDLVRVWHADRWVGIDARTPPRIVEDAWRRGLLPELAAFDRVRREVRLGESRLDLLFEGPSGRCYVETKSVNLVEDGTALFPDAPTTRGARHLRTLIDAVRGGDDATVVFVIQRDDARALSPHVEADPEFARALAEADDAGVLLAALVCCVDSVSMIPTGRVPVGLPLKSFSRSC